MLEKLISAAMRADLVRELVQKELTRLQEGGYLPREEVEQIMQQWLATLEERVDQARATTQPLLERVNPTGLGQSLRKALDLPSRQEILDLTEALRKSHPEPDPI